MNGYERYIATLNGETVDHPARTPILMRWAAEYIGETYGAFLSDHRVLVEANLRCAHDLELDQVSAISDPLRETEGFGGKVEIHPHSGASCEDPPLAQTLDPTLLARPDPHTSPRMRDRVEAVRLFKEKVGGRYSILGWVEGPLAEAADLRRMDNLFMDLYDEGEEVAALLDICTEVAIDFAAAQVEAGADTIGVGDAAASQISADLYEEWVWPREKRLVEAIHAMGARVKLHICGNITHLLPGIARLGIDVLDVDHMVDLAAVRAAVAGKVALAGNVDPVQGVMQSCPEAIRRALAECRERAAGPFLVNAGCEIPAGTPVENLRAFCQPL